MSPLEPGRPSGRWARRPRRRARSGAALRCLGVAIAAATAVSPILAHPGSGIAVDRAGRIFFVDTGHGVWMIDGEGRLREHEGPAFHWMALDAESRFGETPLPHLPSTDLRAAGRDPIVILSSDYPVAVGADGALYFAEPGRDRRLRMVRLAPSGERAEFALLPAESEGAPLRWLNGVAAGGDGSIYYSENAAVRRIDPHGDLSTVARAIEVPECERLPGLPPAMAPYLRGLAVAADGTVYAAANGCSALLRIGAGGEVATILRATPPWSPTAVAIGGEHLYVLEYLHTAEEEVADRRVWIPRVRRLAPDGAVTVMVEVRREPPGRRPTPPLHRKKSN